MAVDTQVHVPLSFGVARLIGGRGGDDWRRYMCDKNGAVLLWGQ